MISKNTLYLYIYCGGVEKMGGSTSSRWGKNYERRPLVEETLAIDIAHFLPFLSDGKKSRGSGVIQVKRKTPPESFPANFILRENAISIYFFKSDGVLVGDDKIKVKAFQRKGFSRAKWLFECSHCGGHFEKLYIRLDNRHIPEEFCCRLGSCLSYESRLKRKKIKGEMV